MLVETSHASIENNEISENIKANIALGGSNSIDTFITNNYISGGRCEGIFVIDGGKTFIFGNKIFENNDGIILVTSIPIITNNYIIHNKRNGYHNYYYYQYFLNV